MFNNRSDPLKKSWYLFLSSIRRFYQRRDVLLSIDTQYLITLTATSKHINTPSVELVVSYINYIALMSTFIIKNIYRYISKKIHSSFCDAIILKQTRNILISGQVFRYSNETQLTFLLMNMTLLHPWKVIDLSWSHQRGSEIVYNIRFEYVRYKLITSIYWRWFWPWIWHDCFFTNMS
jgi:hypothetical protein